MDSPGNFSLQEWHGSQVFCWHGEEAAKYRGKTEAYVEIEKGRITISELAKEKNKTIVCSVFSSPYKEEEVESSHMSEAFVIKRGKMVGSADSMEGTLVHLVEVMSQELKRSVQKIYLLPPSGSFFYKIITLPGGMAPSDLNSAIEMQKNEFVESKLKDEPAVLKSWDLGLVEQKDSKLQHVLLVGVPNASILNFIEVLRSAKLSLTGFLTPQLLYFYLINTADQGKSQIFAEINDYSLRVYFFRSGVLTFIRYIGLPKWKEASQFIRNVGQQIQRSILYLNQQYPDAILDKFTMFNRTSIPNVEAEVAHELESNIESFDVGQFSTFPADLSEKLAEHHVSITSPLYAHATINKIEKITFPLSEFDVRLQNIMRFKAAMVFFILWSLVLGFGFWQFDKVVKSQQENLTGDALSIELEKISKQYTAALNEKNEYEGQQKTLKNLIQLRQQMLCMYYGLLDSRVRLAKKDKLLITQITFAKPQEQEFGAAYPGALELTLGFKILEGFDEAGLTYSTFKNELSQYFKIAGESDERSDNPKEVSRAWKIVLQLKTN